MSQKLFIFILKYSVFTSSGFQRNVFVENAHNNIGHSMRRWCANNRETELDAVLQQALSLSNLQGGHCRPSIKCFTVKKLYKEGKTAEREKGQGLDLYTKYGTIRSEKQAGSTENS